jgi:mono/diheme cytochrome c family protein
MDQRRGINVAVFCLAVVLSLLFGFQNCAPGFITEPTMVNDLASDDGSSLSLQAQSVQILQKECLSCHGTMGDGGVSNITDVHKLIQSGLVIEGDPENSPLIISIIKGSMPPGGTLAESSLQTLEDWIGQLAHAAPSPSPSPSPSPVPPMPEPPPTSSPSLDGPVTVDFKTISSLILIPKCVSCHRYGHSDGGIRYDTYISTMQTVNKTDPTNSLLYIDIQSGRMPINPMERLTAAEVDMILKWIQAGAPDNTSSSPVSPVHSPGHF